MPGPSSRFAVAIHVLLILAMHPGRSICSDSIASSVGTNPVLIRRMMCTLRSAGLVASRAGSLGGFTLGKPATGISLDVVYHAVEESQVFHQHEPNKDCPIGRRIQPICGKVFTEAETALVESLKDKTIADLVDLA
jgi:Rrf2 family protein